MNASVLLLLTIFGCVFGNNENQAKLRLYFDSMDNYTEYSIEDIDGIITSSWYDPSRPTVMFTHGFTGHPKGPAITAVITALIEEDKSNVALLNWEKLAAAALPGLLSSYMNFALPNSIQVGMDFSETMAKLSALGFDLNNTRLIGHSLGAHVFGITGNKLKEKGLELPWITGLDPAIGFDMKPAFLRLNPSSAKYVDVIHTDPNKYGTRKEMGFVDFWPNFRTFGYVLQPGCPEHVPRLSDEDFCSHNKAWQFLVDAMKHPGTVMGSHAKNFRTWKKLSQTDRKSIVLELGTRNENAMPGNYFLITAAESPFGLGDDGL